MPKLYAAIGVGLVLIALYFVIDARGFQRGYNQADAMWQKRESVELAALNNKIIDLTNKARENERKHAIELAAISTRYQELLNVSKRLKESDRAAIARGDLRLRDPAAAGEGSCRGGTGETATATGGRNDTARGGFSVAASQFLLEITTEADDVVRQLSACQEIVRSDRMR